MKDEHNARRGGLALRQDDDFIALRRRIKEIQRQFVNLRADAKSDVPFGVIAGLTKLETHLGQQLYRLFVARRCKRP